MANKPIVIMPLAAALAALGGLDAVVAATSPEPEQTTQQVGTNAELMAGEKNLLGLTVSRQADGTVLAQRGHGSHASGHAAHYSSHGSHGSHVSSSR